MIPIPIPNQCPCMRIIRRNPPLGVIWYLKHDLFGTPAQAIYLLFAPGPVLENLLLLRKSLVLIWQR